MTRLVKTLRQVAVVAALALVSGVLVQAPAQARVPAPRDGYCDSGEFCYYYNSGNAGSISDFSGSLGDYGARQPTCYEFKGAGAGRGQCIKNNAASVWNRTQRKVYVHYNSGFRGPYHALNPGDKGNLKPGLKNENASHQFGGIVTTRGSADSNDRLPAGSNLPAGYVLVSFSAPSRGWKDPYCPGLDEAIKYRNEAAMGFSWLGCVGNEAMLDYFIPALEGCLGGAIGQNFAQFVVTKTPAGIPASAVGCVLGAASNVGVKVYGINSTEIRG